MCGNWVDVNEDDLPEGATEQKVLELGTSRKTFTMIKRYKQAPVEYQVFKNEQVNQLAVALELNSFAKLTWSLMGANHPQSQAGNPETAYPSATFENAMTTKSFKTLEGSIYIGDTEDTLTQIRQIPSFSLTINNNMEATQALFEKEAIEQSLGDFEVTGSFDVWKADDIARTLSNDAIAGKTKIMKVTVSREVAGETTSYEIKLVIHLDNSTESKDGNKLKNTIEFSIASADGLKFTKTVSE